MRLSILLVAILFLSSCGSSDKELILGKWESEDFWFEFHDETKYSGGRGPLISQREQEYVLEPSEKKLTFYTNQESESYYLIYEFVGTDTLILTNSMNSTSVPARYYKTKQQ